MGKLSMNSADTTQEREIRSISDFLDALRKDLDAKPGIVWFRGHADASWELIPGIMRNDHIASESTLLNRFKQSAAMLTDSRPNSFFDWTFLMQHYGVPTRLLDWSESPLVSLYFAVEGWEKRPDTCASIWCLWPAELNKNANIVDKHEHQYIPSFEDEEISAYDLESVRQNSRLELFPVATIATRNNPRIQAQMGTFTIHHNKKISIERVGEGGHVKKYNISHKSRKNIAEELRILGVTRFSLFPELESVGSMLKDMKK